MTMVHFDTKAISRKVGQSAVACAAYRAGDVLDDAKYGKTHDYSKKRGVMSSDIVLPFALKVLGMSVDRETLWNLAEAAENRSDSRVAREWLINLPYALSEEERHTLAIEFAQKLCNDMDVIADVCIHRPVMKLPFDPQAKPSSKRLREGEENPDPRNFHAHILVTTRAPIAGPNKTLAFDPNLKIPFEWSNKKRLAHDLPSSMKEIKRIREMWVDTANVVLAKKNLPLMDARSYKDQGRDQQPTIKMGVEATAMERRGITTEKGDINREIIARNQAVTEQTIQQGSEHERRVRALRKGLAWTTEHNARLPELLGDTTQRIDDSERCLNSAEQGLREAEPEINWSSEDGARATNRTYQAKRRIEAANDGAATAGQYAESLPELIRDTEQLIANTKSNLEWTARRCENLPKRSDDTQQRIDDSKRWITQNSERVQASKSITDGINSGITERARPAPSPFDDNYRRAFLERKRQIDRELREADEATNRRQYTDERIFESAERMKRYLAMRLIQRHHHTIAISWAKGETAEDFPDKFDQRQVAILSEFAQTHDMENNDNALGFGEHLQQVVKRFGHDFVENNISVIQLLRDPKTEREQYLKFIKHFESFKDDIDQKREVFNTSLIDKLGGSAGDVGQMTRDILSSFSYMDDLDCYINDDSHTTEAKEIAKAHQADTLNKTCHKFKIAFRDVNTLATTQRKTYSEALKATLETFTEQYSKVLSESQQKAIQGGLESYEYQVNRFNTPNRILDL